MKVEFGNDSWDAFYYVVFALLCILFGLMMYFFLPYSILTFNFFWLLVFMFLILFGYLVGFILLSLNIQYLFERGIYYLVRLYTPQHLAFIALKNMAAHRLRNRKTSLMYSISISFVMFLWTCSNLMISNASQ